MRVALARSSNASSSAAANDSAAATLMPCSAISLVRREKLLNGIDTMAQDQAGRFDNQRPCPCNPFLR